MARGSSRRAKATIATAAACSWPARASAFFLNAVRTRTWPLRLFSLIPTDCAHRLRTKLQSRFRLTVDNFVLVPELTHGLFWGWR